MYNKSVLQYCRYIKNDDDDHHHHEPRTKFNLIERMEGKYLTNKQKGPEKNVLGADLHGELITFRLDRLT